MKKTLVKDIYSYYEVINNTFKLFINHIFEMFDNEKWTIIVIRTSLMKKSIAVICPVLSPKIVIGTMWE